MSNHDYMGFSQTLDEDDYGIIIGKDGAIKGIWVPQHLEDQEQVPEPIAKYCVDNFGVDPNNESCYHTIH